MEHIARGKDAGNAGLVVLIHKGAPGAPVHRQAGAVGDVPGGDEAHRENQRVALHPLLRAGDGAEAFVDLGDRNGLQTRPAVNIGDGMAQVQGDAIVVEALLDVAGQAAGIGLHFIDGLHMGPLQRHAAGHDHADVAAAQNDHLPAHHEVAQVDVLLGHAGGVDARRAAARNGQGAPGTLPAAHGENHRVAPELFEPGGAGGGDGAVGLQGENGGVGKTGDAQLLRLGHEPLGVLGAGEGLAEAGEAEAVVDALTKDAAGAVLTFQHHHVVDALLPEPDGGGQAGGPAADDYRLMAFHVHAGSPPFTDPVNIQEPSGPRWMSLKSSPSSRWRASVMRVSQ